MRPLLAVLCGALLVGCGAKDEMSKSDEQSFRKSIDAGKDKLDPNTLPPDVRDRVKGIMEAQKHMAGGPVPSKK